MLRLQGDRRGAINPSVELTEADRIGPPAADPLRQCRAAAPSFAVDHFGTARAALERLPDSGAHVAARRDQADL